MIGVRTRAFLALPIAATSTPSGAGQPAAAAPSLGR